MDGGILKLPVVTWTRVRFIPLSGVEGFPKGGGGGVA